MLPNLMALLRSVILVFYSRLKEDKVLRCFIIFSRNYSVLERLFELDKMRILHI